MNHLTETGHYERLETLLLKQNLLDSNLELDLLLLPARQIQGCQEYYYMDNILLLLDPLGQLRLLDLLGPLDLLDLLDLLGPLDLLDPLDQFQVEVKGDRNIRTEYENFFKFTHFYTILIIYPLTLYSL